MPTSLVITVLMDNPVGYLHLYMEELLSAIRERGHDVIYIRDVKEIRKGDLLFILGCYAILTPEQLSLNKHNLVVHPSKLPEGRGSAALVTKILEGENTVWLTLFEAVEKVDKGDYYYQESITFEGHELSDEIREKQSRKVFAMVLEFLDDYPNIEAKPQIGEGSFIKRRTAKDSALDMDKTIREQFNLLRIVDNKHYPAYFDHLGHRYKVQISKHPLPQ